jgi:hypothetical protein
MRELDEICYDIVIDSSDKALGELLRRHLPDEVLEGVYELLTEHMVTDKLNNVDYGDSDDR